MHRPSLLLTLVLILGHALVVRSLLNLAFRVGMPHGVWKAVCLLHLLVGIAVPTWFVREVGLRGPKVLERGDWSRVDRVWLGYGGICAAALVLVPAVNLLRGRRRPAAVLGRESQVSHAHDLPAGLPVGTGPGALLARFPGNELLRVEVAEQEIALPGLPPAWDGLSVLHLSDLHFNGSPDRAFFEWALARGAAMNPDLVALTGDILDRHALADWLPSTLGQFRAPLGCYFVLGNHDVYDEPARIRAAVAALGWTDVGGTHVSRDIDPNRGDGGGGGGPLLIAGTEVPWLGAHPDVNGASGAGLRVLLSHGPHDFGWAQRRGFDLVLAGHLHGGQVRLPLLGSICGGRYEAGTFQRGRTVMHVSRGLGQIAPLRFRCPPEITKLVLRAGGGTRRGGRGAAGSLLGEL
jgi:predicted MPP superfamily phosphohydrolase